MAKLMVNIFFNGEFMKQPILFVTIALMTIFFSVLTFAETTTMEIAGMHCGGCQKMVTKAVCADAKISATVSECKVTVDTEKQIGTLVLKSKEQKTIDLVAVEKAIQSAGEDYKIIKKTTLK
jgi:hypothetical protein